MNKRQWKCPECGNNKLEEYGRNRWVCTAYHCTSSSFSKKTIQALVGNSVAQMTAAFTTSPPGYPMPWESPMRINQSSVHCECGGEKTGGAHSSWCPKAGK